jgi:hypothetical protein
MLVVIIPAIGWAARRRSARTGRPVGREIIHARFAVAGVVIGGAWIWRAGASLWEHALRVLVVLLIAAPTLSYLRRRHAKRNGRPVGYFPMKELVIAKLGLITVAVGLQWALQKAVSTTTASVVVGIAMAVTVGVGGPLLQRHVIRKRISRR